MKGMKEYHRKKDNYFDECIGDNVTYNLTDYVNDTDELEKLLVKFSVSGHANEHSGKTTFIDFVGIHIEDS